MAAPAGCRGSRGCGGDDQPELARLEGGVARGAGFEFRLSDDWSALADNDRRDLFAEYGKKELPELDVGAGLLDVGAGLLSAGLWIRREERDKRPSVNVVVEPITADTSLDAHLAGALQLVKQQGEEAQATRQIELDGELGAAYRFSEVEEDGVERVGLLAVHGDLGYTVTVQQRGGAAQVEDLLDRIAVSWRWVEPEG